MRHLVRSELMRLWTLRLLVFATAWPSAALAGLGSYDSQPLRTLSPTTPAVSVVQAAKNGLDPTETAARPPPLGFVSILIDAQRLTLTVFSDEEVWARFAIAAGKASTPTPLGEWRVVNKAIWARGFGTRWMGLSVPFAAYGMHGTSDPGSIGSHASAGCIRLHNANVETVFRWVSVGTPVKITGTPRTHFGEMPRLMRPSYVGTDVMALQQRLKELGLYRLRVDGRYEAGTVRAVRDFQWVSGLPVTGLADQATREALGLP